MPNMGAPPPLDKAENPWRPRGAPRVACSDHPARAESRPNRAAREYRRSRKLVSVTTLVRLSDVIGVSAVDLSGNQIGTVEDLVARFAEEGFPPVTGAVVAASDRRVFLPASRLGELGGSMLAYEGESEILGSFERRPGEVLLRRDVLGRQLIHIDDSHNARLVRAAEIDLALVEGEWRVAGVDAARRSWLPWRKHNQDEHPYFVEWTSLDAFMRHVPTSRLRLRTRRLAELHPGEIADLVESASPDEGEEIIEALGDDKALEADVFEELDREHRLELVKKRSDHEVAGLLSHMAPDDAVDLLSELDQSRRSAVLAAMPPSQERRLRRLLDYNPNTAGGIMSPGFVSFSSDLTVGEALERLRSTDLGVELLDTVFVSSPASSARPEGAASEEQRPREAISEQGNANQIRGIGIGGVVLSAPAREGDDTHEQLLSGSLRLRELLRAPLSATLSELADPDPPAVRTSADIPEVALIMSDYNLTSLAVVDDAGCLSGVITVDDVLAQLIPQAWRRRAEAIGD